MRIDEHGNPTNMVWWYFLEDCQISAKGNVLTTGVKMTEEEVENAQSWLNDHGFNHLRWHPMDPD